MFNGLIDEVDNKDVIFNIASNGESSSILEFGTHSTHHPHVKFVDTHNCKTTRLDSLIDNNKIPIENLNFLNLDIQGVELRAMKSMEKYLQFVDYIYTEVNVEEVYSNCDNMNAIDEYLGKHGFKRIETRIYQQFGWGDAFYIKQSQWFDKCFDKHDFNELNNLDYNILNNAIDFFKQTNQNNNSIFFDVGCNAGSFVKVLENNNFKNNIHCFEPHPKLSNIVIEKYPYVKMNKICLTDNIGTIDINIPVWSVGLSSIIERPIFNTLKDGGQEIAKLNVNTNTIDNYCNENNIEYIDFIKIDVEGAEKIVLDGANNMLRNNKIKMGLFEVGETLRDANTSEHDICNMLEKYNYKIMKEIPNNYLFYI